MDKRLRGRALLLCVPIAAQLALSGCASLGRGRDGRIIRFSGYEWTVRGDEVAPRGPGPNFFGMGSDSVRVDHSGRLHLRLERRGGRWVCAEVASLRRFGRGSFRWTLAPGAPLPRGVVLGLFTWDDDDPPHHREADIEFLDEGAPQVLFSVQPAQSPGRSRAFPGALGPVRSTQSLHLKADRVEFESVSEGGEARRWVSEVPVAEGPVNVMMNLWLRAGTQPADWTQSEVVIESFEFLP